MSGPPFDADIPVAGCYKVKLVKGGPPCGLRLWYGSPVDPLTGEEMDRSPRWNATLNGREQVDPFRFWPACARDPISEADHLHICRLSATMDPNDPYFDPRRPMDPGKAPPPF
jgi:hypothetical protein